MEIPLELQNDAESHSFENVPYRSDLHLVKKSDYEFLLKTWTNYVSIENDKEHPNNHLDFRMAAIEHISENFIVVNVCIDQMKRYHSVIIVLPKGDFIACVQFFNYERRAYLIVSDEWFKDLSSYRYSTFALVDADGVKNILRQNGVLDKKKLRKFKNRLNCLSRKYRRYLIVSFADSVFIKRSWRGSISYYYDYNPEEMLYLVQKVQLLFQEELGLGSYAVLSQGTTVDYGSNIYEKAFLGNHFSIGSLGSPVAHLFEIDVAARENSRKKIHPRCSLYLSIKFFQTLSLNSDFKNKLKDQKISFNSKVSEFDDNIYIPVDIDEIILNFKEETFKELLSRLQFNYLWSLRTFAKQKIRSWFLEK